MSGRGEFIKSPSALATSFDIVVGIFSGLWYVLRHQIQVVHARSYVPAVMALTLKKLTGIKFIFDILFLKYLD